MKRLEVIRDLVHIGIAGRWSPWELLSSCIDLLELDLDTADWMDLYAEGMDENGSTTSTRSLPIAISSNCACVHSPDKSSSRTVPCISAAPCRSTKLPIP